MAVITNLASYWALNEASGNALDAHGSNALTEGAGAVASATGKVGNCRSWTPIANQYFTKADNASLSVTSDFAFALWAKTSDNGTRGLLGKDDFGSNREYILYFQSGTIVFKVQDSSSGESDATTGSGYDDGNWHFIVAQYTSSDKIARVYIDDVVRATGGALTNGPRDAAAIFELGSVVTNTYLFAGLIDEVGFWKATGAEALSSAQRTWLYNSGNGRSYADIVAEGVGGTPSKKGMLLGIGEAAALVCSPAMWRYQRMLKMKKAR